MPVLNMKRLGVLALLVCTGGTSFWIGTYWDELRGDRVEFAFSRGARGKPIQSQLELAVARSQSARLSLNSGECALICGPYSMRSRLDTLSRHLPASGLRRLASVNETTEVSFGIIAANGYIASIEVLPGAYLVDGLIEVLPGDELDLNPSPTLPGVVAITKRNAPAASNDQ
ncbi:MAG: hypothetical protein IT436_06960 [Phycisphaerales bacterium]|nr:hypothetical protein [Phycisphaerales bacterium]